MEIIINISEETYIATCQGHMLPPDIENVINAIKNSKQLPKNHGRIIDESKIEKIYYHIENCESDRFRIEHTVIDGTDAPTIIERSTGE